MSSINHTPPGRRGTASAIIEKTIRDLSHLEDDRKEIEGFIVDVLGPEGTSAVPGQREFGGLWFELALKSGDLVKVQSDMDYSALRTQFGSNDNCRGRMCRVIYSGTGLSAIENGRATIISHGGAFYQDEDTACSVFSLSGISGILQEDAPNNNAISKAGAAKGE